MYCSVITVKSCQYWRRVQGGIMEVVLSGQAAKAVISQEGKHYLYYLDGEDYCHNEIPFSSIHQVFLNCTDVTSHRSVNFAEVKSLLESAWSNDCALHLTLILLNQGEERATRMMASECLDELLAAEPVSRHVKYFTYSAPMPDTTNLAESYQIAYSIEHQRNSAFLLELDHYQDEIALRRKAWDDLPHTIFGSNEYKLYLQALLIRHGAFWLFVTEKSRSESVLLNLLVNEQLRGIKHLRNGAPRMVSPFQGENIEF